MSEPTSPTNATRPMTRAEVSLALYAAQALSNWLIATPDVFYGQDDFMTGLHRLTGALEEGLGKMNDESKGHLMFADYFQKDV